MKIYYQTEMKVTPDIEFRVFAASLFIVRTIVMPLVYHDPVIPIK